MNRIGIVLFSVAIMALSASAQMLPIIPGPEKDSTGKFKLFDYSIPLEGISDPGILLSHFSQRPLLVFYYSPKCPHCQTTFPKFQAIVSNYEPKGLQGLAISVGQMKKNDIRMFMDQQNCRVPMFMDGNRKFSDLYGTGHVPLIMFVKENGQYIRYTENNDQALADLKAELNKHFSKK